MSKLPYYCPDCGVKTLQGGYSPDLAEYYTIYECGRKVTMPDGGTVKVIVECPKPMAGSVPALVCGNCGCNKYDSHYDPKYQVTTRSFACGMDEKQHDGDLEVINITPCFVDTEYGLCPICGARGKTRERRPNGNDICVNDHKYPSVDAIKVWADKPVAVPLSEFVDKNKIIPIKIKFEKNLLVMNHYGRWVDQYCSFSPEEMRCGLQCPHCVMDRERLKLCHGTTHYVEVINESTSNQ